MAIHDYNVEYQPETAHDVADEVSRLLRSNEEQDLVDDEDLCLGTDSSPGGEAA